MSRSCPPQQTRHYTCNIFIVKDLRVSCCSLSGESPMMVGQPVQFRIGRIHLKPDMPAGLIAELVGGLDRQQIDLPLRELRREE